MRCVLHCISIRGLQKIIIIAAVLISKLIFFIFTTFKIFAKNKFYLMYVFDNFISTFCFQF